MNKKYKNIDSELFKAISSSPFCYIDYENLLEKNPKRIRYEENKISFEGVSIPNNLKVENKIIRSLDGKREISLRIYKPIDKKNLAIFLFFHGGSFVFGTPDQYDFNFYELAIEVPMLIVSVAYRLAPENPFPAAMLDGYETLIWLSKNAREIGGNKDNIIIGGSSAGGTIATSITQFARDMNEDIIKYLYLLYPPMSQLMDTNSMNEFKDAPLQTKKSAKWMWKHYLKNNLKNPPKYSVPLLEDNYENLPETTIIVAELDPLKDEAIQYGLNLKKAGISVNQIEIKNSVHNFDFFTCSISILFYKKQLKIFRDLIK